MITTPLPIPRPARLVAAVLASAALALAAPSWAAPEGVRVVATPGGLHLTVDVPGANLVPVAFEPRVSELQLEGYYAAGRPGEPLLRERVITVAVPPTGGVTIEAVGAATDVHEPVVLAALPFVPRGKELGPLDDAGRALVTSFLDAAKRPVETVPAARLLGVTWLREQRVARIAVDPASWDAASRRLSVHRRVEIDVRFSGANVASGAPAGRAAVAGPFEPVYRDLLPNYEQGLAWRRAPARRGAAGVQPVRAIDLQDATLGVPTTSVYAGRRWVKIAIPQSGFYKVYFGQVRNSAAFGGRDSVPLDSIRLFTWPGYPVLPELSYCDSCDFKEVAIQFVVQGNGIFNDNDRDYLYFYAMGASDWADNYDASYPDTTFINDPYEARNYVYLTVADSLPLGGTPRRIGAETTSPDDTLGVPIAATYRARIHFEIDTGSEYWPDPTSYSFGFQDGSYRVSGLFWEKWYWKTFANAFSTTLAAPDVDSSQPARLRARVWGINLQPHSLDATFGPITFPRQQWIWTAPRTLDTTFVGLPVAADLSFDVASTGGNDVVGFAWADLFYQRSFVPQGNALAFDSSPAGGTWHYKIGPFVTSRDTLPRVFDVTDPLAPIEIVGAAWDSLAPRRFQLRFRRTEPGLRRYRVIPEGPGLSLITKVPAADVVDAPSSSLINLRQGPAGGADYVLIYYDGFKAAADTLLRWREERLPGGAPPHRVYGVPISAIYDQFSGGRTDPAAIRNFLRAAYYNWESAPDYVTLLGDASYDFKNISGQAPPGQPGALVPSWEGGWDKTASRQYSTDDWLFNVNDPNVALPDFYGGRIPAADAGAAMTYVRDKLLAYERSAPLGNWRNRVILLADDNEQGNRADTWLHFCQTVDLDRIIPSHVDRAYVYLHTYPDGAGGATKPAARDDLIAQLEKGAVLFNYVGHGSPFKLTDEAVFLEGDAGALTNAPRLSLFIAASCDVGKYNDPKVQSLGETLVMRSGGGTIGVIAATELAFSFENAALDLVIFQELFKRDSTAGTYLGLAAPALLRGKILAGNPQNAQKYQLMGDAAVRLVLPRRTVEVTLHDAAGNPIADIQRGQTLKARGRVLDRPGGTLVPFNGLVDLLIEDSQRLLPRPVGPGAYCDSIPFRASPMFRGDVSVNGGSFEATFVAPLDAQLGPRGRIRAYVAGADEGWDSDGVGSLRVGIVPGQPSSGDVEGPRITLGFPGGATSVRPDAILKVDLFDVSGILTTSNAAQNGIIVTVDGNSNDRHEITTTFRYAANSYQSGTAFYQLAGLSPGPHTISVSAADNLASGINASTHRSSATITFEVTDNPALHVSRTFLFPSPTTSMGPGAGGRFVVDAPGDSVNVLLKIYTVAGKLIRVLESRGGLGQIQIPWDGRDSGGFPLATGVYLYRVHVNPRDPDGSSSPRQKAVAEGRFVIHGR